MKTILLCVAVSLLLHCGTVLAVTPADQCRAAKNFDAGKYAKCLKTAEKKLIGTGDMTKYGDAIAKCGDKYSAAWQKAEQKAADAGDPCPTMSDETLLKNAILADAACIASALQGNTSCLSCGNGSIDSGEDCDLGALGGADCSTATGGTLSGGVLACGAGCVFNTTGCYACPIPGVSVGGFCWYLGSGGADCDATCAAQGLTYDAATLGYAGSSGTDAHCIAVLDALAVPAGGLANSGPGTTGCMWCNGSPGVCPIARWRDTSSPTTAAGFGGPVIQRACACH